VQSFIAVVGLTGLVVNDAIVLIDFINLQRDRGLALEDAVRSGAHQRVRPIIMTTWSTIAGLIPLAIGIPDFSITWGPFATCFIAGLSMSTLITLLILPVLYILLERFKSRWVG
jgi:multidrug efflux pump subunit AcrB